MSHTVVGIRRNRLWHKAFFLSNFRISLHLIQVQSWHRSISMLHGSCPIASPPALSTMMCVMSCCVISTCKESSESLLFQNRPNHVQASAHAGSEHCQPQGDRQTDVRQQGDNKHVQCVQQSSVIGRAVEKTKDRCSVAAMIKDTLSTRPSGLTEQKKVFWRPRETKYTTFSIELNSVRARSDKKSFGCLGTTISYNRTVPTAVPAFCSGK